MPTSSLSDCILVNGVGDHVSEATTFVLLPLPFGVSWSDYLGALVMVESARDYELFVTEHHQLGGGIRLYSTSTAKSFKDRVLLAAAPSARRRCCHRKILVSMLWGVCVRVCLCV